MPDGHNLNREKPPHPRNIIGKAMRRARKEAKPKITQEDLCGRLAKFGLILTRTQIAKIEAGRRPVFDYEAITIAKSLKIPLARLFSIE